MATKEQYVTTIHHCERKEKNHAHTAQKPIIKKKEKKKIVIKIDRLKLGDLHQPTTILLRVLAFPLLLLLFHFMFIITFMKGNGTYSS